MMSIQWYPGHMVAAQKKAAETMAFTDVVIEVLDARMPGASQNPTIQELSAYRQRAHLKVLNKSDLADPFITSQWVQYFNKLPQTKAIAISCKKINEPKKIFALCKTLAPHRASPLKPLRMMIMGVPNVGKSTLMNALLNKKIAKVGNEPAVTKQQQRHIVNDHMILIDTPGIMSPKIGYSEDGELLAINYSIGNNAYLEEEIAEKLASILLEKYSNLISLRYQIEGSLTSPLSLLEWIAKKRGLPLKNKRPDLLKASEVLLNDYRAGLLGRISLESPHSRLEMIQQHSQT